MPFYIYTCKSGHTTTEMRPIADRDKRMKCPTKGCKRRASRDRKAEMLGGGVFIEGDIPDHFNLSIERRVKSRRHLKELQKRLGVEDYDPGPAKRGPSSSWQG